MSNLTTNEIELCIERMQSGDLAARDQLLTSACDRLRKITEKMMRQFPAVQRFEQSDDVLQNAVIRLSRSLKQLTPRTARDFFGLASLEIRRELIDLMRHYYGPLGQGAREHALPVDDSDAPAHPAYHAPDTTNEPGKLAVWAEFHRHVESLSNEDREMFDLLWYQDLTQTEAAKVLGVSERTVKRRWQHARLAVDSRLKG
ncbi:MAG: sigma-70 family RNA polymerase sigma factor [Planctomycetota bacterium]|nr:sigma-70 family RNA polymerase sigma factor [Planctomycetota bacterium]